MLKKYKVIVNGKDYLVEVEEIGKIDLEKNVEINESKPEKIIELDTEKNSKKENSNPVAEKEEVKSTGRKEIISPMAGTILEVLVNEGDKIEKNKKILILEAMKMEHSILSDFEGKLSVLKIKTGQNVDAGEVLAILE